MKNQSLILWLLLAHTAALPAYAAAEPAVQEETQGEEGADLTGFLVQMRGTLTQLLAERGIVDPDFANAIQNAPFVTDGAPCTITATREGANIVFHSSADILNDIERSAARTSDPKATGLDAFVVHMAAAIAEAECLWLCEKPEQAPAQEVKDALKLAVSISALTLCHHSPAGAAAVLELPACPIPATARTEAAGDAIVFDAEQGLITGMSIRRIVPPSAPPAADTPSTATEAPAQEETTAQPAPEEPTAQPAPAQEDATAQPTPEEPTPTEQPNVYLMDTSAEFRQVIQDFAPPENKDDAEGFRAALAKLTSARAVATELKLVREAHLPAILPYGDTYEYQPPTVCLAVAPGWIDYYTRTVAPKLDAFFRPLAVSVLETDEVMYITRKSGSILFQLNPLKNKWRKLLKSAPKGCCYYRCWVPESPDEWKELKEGLNVRMKLRLYCLPAAFTPPEPPAADTVDGTPCYWHTYDKEGNYISSHNPVPLQGVSWQRCVGDAHDANGWSFGWLLDDNLTTEAHPTFTPLPMPKKIAFGGSRVTLADQYASFPGLREKEEAEALRLKQEQEKDAAEKEQRAAYAASLRPAAELGLPEVFTKIEQASDASALCDACRELGQMNDPRRFSATLHGTPKLLPFEQLSPMQAAEGKHWLRMPAVTLHVNEDWLKLYCEQIYPRLQLLFSKLSTKERVVQVAAQVQEKSGYTNGLRIPVLDAVEYIDPVLIPFAGDDTASYKIVLVRPVGDIHPGNITIGSTLQLELSMYLLPAAYKSFFSHGGLCHTDGVVHVTKNGHPLVAHYYNHEVSHWFTPSAAAALLDPLALTPFTHGAGFVKPYEINTPRRLQDVPLAPADANENDVLEGYTTAIGQDILNRQLQQLIDKLLEHKLISPEHEPHLRSIDALSLVFSAGSADAVWPFTPDSFLYTPLPAYVVADSKLMRDYTMRNLISVEKLSREEQCVAWLSFLISNYIVHHTLTNKPPVLADTVARDKTLEKALSATAPYVAITALNLLGYGPYDETLIPRFHRCVEQIRPIGKWDAEQHLLNLNAPPASAPADHAPAKMQQNP